MLAGDAWIAEGNYHETLDLRLERADSVVVLDMPWWLCSGRALVRGFRMPGELPAGCDYPRWMRLRDEWRLAFRIWRKRRSEPVREHEIISQHGQPLAVHVLRTKGEVSDFLAGWPLTRAAPHDDESAAECLALTADSGALHALDSQVPAFDRSRQGRTHGARVQWAALDGWADY